MEIRNSVALVTGANRGLGRRLAAGLLERGARKVYAAARNPEAVDLPGVTPLRLDITDPVSVAAAAAAAADVTVLVNNAGSSTRATLLDGDPAAIRLEMETHYFGTLAVTRAFAPIIAANGGGAVLNVLSVLSWFHPATSGAYSAAKAAELALTNSLRLELAPRGITTTALHVGYMDTDMVAHLDVAKSDPAVIAALALDGVADSALEVVADDVSRTVRSGLSAELPVLYPQLTAAAPAGSAR
ncbi:short-subunit dehydrogenase [Pseudonocardia hierapolitana]|uniref:Short-subunit dehydrogenase n=1 Tax=Pseudonocardia hierapolitana TaxID=1128676 RepID=A0A561SV55_9PSEU|nr:SDR family oxidoreductase [Pseudonocardia hierapolitana]TWF78747.1 short-subunit dehydrogenase [Pseudonocardia hierapolitana]